MDIPHPSTALVFCLVQGWHLSLQATRQWTQDSMDTYELLAGHRSTQQCTS